MKLKKLIILRHGEPEGRGFLTPNGRKTIDVVAGRLKSEGHLDLRSIAVICSYELRALKSAQAFLTTLSLYPEIDEECYKALFSSDMACDTNAALSVIDEYADRVNTLVIFTHLEMVERLPARFCSQVFGRAPNLPIHPGYSEGCIIDCVAKTCEET